MRTRNRIGRLSRLVAPLALAALTAGSLSAQSQTELPTEGGELEVRHPEAEEAIGKLWSPYCPGFMLEVCSSRQGAALRDSIQDLAASGWTSEEIVEWMLENHGEEYLAMPQGSGAGLLAWLAPPVAGFLGAVVVFLVLRRLIAARRETIPAEGFAELSDEEEARLREAMRQADVEEDAPIF